MMKKTIVIVGGGLAGCILSIKIATRFKNAKIILIESGYKLINSYQSIKIGSTYVNNGYHAIEIDRAKKLYKFLKDQININFIIKLKKRFLFFNHIVFKENLKYKEFPASLKQDLKITKIKSNNFQSIFRKVGGEFRKTVVSVSQRYSNNLKENLRFFIPWFFPKEYDYLSKDEGDIFRYKSKKQLKNYLAVPKNFLFNQISEKIEKKIKLIQNITIYKNSKLEFYKSKIVLLKKKNKIMKIEPDHIFVTTMPTFFISYFTKSEKKIINHLFKNKKFFYLILLELKKNIKLKFSEILCCIKNHKEILRISKVNELNKKLLIEMILDKPKTYKIKKENINASLKPILNKNQILKIKKKLTRVIFFPGHNDIITFKKIIDKKITLFRKKGLSISYNPYLGPINMSKSWILSTKFYKEANEILSR